MDANGMWWVVPSIVPRSWQASGLAQAGLGQSKCFWIESPGVPSPLQEHNTVAMELHGRREPLCLSRKHGLPPPAFDFQPLQTSTLHGTNPLPPSSTPSSAKPEPLPAFTPPLWLLYLCRSLEAETSIFHNLTFNSTPQAFPAWTLPEANSPSIPPLHRKHRTHFPSFTTRKPRLTPEASTESIFE
jgi:hypothetical protein